MRNYELMMILDSELDERIVPQTIDKMLQVIPAGGGTINSVDFWGRRRLAYEINKHAEGYYAVIDMNATPELAKELDRQLGINELVLRVKLMRPDAH